MAYPLPTYDQVREEIAYDPLLGSFTRIKATARLRAGCDPTILDTKHGYPYVYVCCRTLPAHRVAWLLMTGAYPPPNLRIDHINNDRTDTRWINLRLATATQNNWNMRVTSKNKAGIKGIYFDRERNRWAAQICVHKRRISLGRFDTADEASGAYRVAALKHFGEYARS